MVRHAKPLAFVHVAPGKWSTVILSSAVCLVVTMLGAWYLLQ